MTVARACYPCQHSDTTRTFDYCEEDDADHDDSVAATKQSACADGEYYECTKGCRR